MAARTNGGLAPLAPDTLSDRVFARLRERILRGDLRQGEFIREQEVSDALQVSRTPVRHALTRLAAEGFLERLPNRGYRIPEEPIEDLLELYPVIAALELLAGRLSMPRITRTDVARLRQLNRNLERALTRGDLRAGIELNHAFHHLMSSHCGNRNLSKLLDELRVRVARLEFWSSDQPVQVHEAVAQHEQIIVLIEQKRFAQALRMLKKNRLQTRTAFLQEMRGADRAGRGR